MTTVEVQIEAKIWYYRGGWMIQPYFADDVEELKGFAFRPEDHKEYPIKDVLRNLERSHALVNTEYVNEDEFNPEDFFMRYNRYETNPLSIQNNPEKQELVRETKTHTSMSVGDIIETNDAYYICMGIGFGKILKPSVKLRQDLFEGLV